MNVINADLLEQSTGGLKFILNDSAIVFFPATQQHRDTKSHGLSYEDDILNIRTQKEKSSYV